MSTLHAATHAVGDDNLFHDWLQSYGSVNAQGDGAAYQDTVWDLDVGPDGEVGVVGTFTGTLLDKDGNEWGPLHNNRVSVFMSVLDADTGDNQWARCFVGEQDGAANAYALCLGDDVYPADRGDPVIYAGGNYKDEVDFGPNGTVFEVWTSYPYDQEPHTLDAWVAKLDRSQPPADQVRWLHFFFGPGSETVRGIDVSPPLGDVPPGESEPLEIAAYVAAVGDFTEEIDFDLPNQGSHTAQSNGGTDAFLAVLHYDEVSTGDLPGHAIHRAHLTFGGTGSDKAFDVDFVRLGLDGYVYVTGSFSGTNVDFDPAHDPGNGSDVSSRVGATDIFAAKYHFSPAADELELVWLYTRGETGIDEGRAIVRDRADNKIYLTGSVNFGQGARSDLWIACLEEYSNGELNPNGGWEHVIADAWAEGGLDIDLLKDNGPVISGFFGKERPEEDSACSTCIQYSLDFDSRPSPYDDIHTTSAGYDLFLTAYDEDGMYQWTKTYGGDWNEAARGVGVDWSTGRLTHAGCYGYDSAGSGYNLYFGDAGGPPAATSRGKGDAYIHSLYPGSILIHHLLLMLVDTSGSVSADEFQVMKDTMKAMLDDPDVVPRPLDGSIVLGIAYFGSSFSDPLPFRRLSSEGDIDDIKENVIDVFPATGGGTYLADAILNGAAPMLVDGLDLFDTFHVVVNVLAEGEDNQTDDLAYNNQQVQAGRDALVAAGAQQINAIGIREDFDDATVPNDSSPSGADLEDYLEELVCWGDGGIIVDYCTPIGYGFYRVVESFTPSTDLLNEWTCKMDAELEGCPTACIGNVTGGCGVDQSDLGALLACYGVDTSTDPGCGPADLDLSGIVGQEDLGILLADYGCGIP